MMDEYLSPISQEELKKRKSQNVYKLGFKYLIKTALACSVTSFSLYLLDEKSFPFYLLAAVAAAGIYIGSRLADTISSIKVAESRIEANSLNTLPPGIDFVETNSMYPNSPQKEHFLKHGSHIFDYAYVLPAVLFPPYGIYLGIQGFLASSQYNLINDWLQKQIRTKKT